MRNRPLLLLAALAFACSTPGSDSSQEPAPAPLAIPQPAVGPITEPVTLTLKKYGGWRHEGGDRDMGTEDDESTELRLTSRLVRHPSSVELTGIFRCRENDNNWTAFSGPLQFNVYEAPGGYEVARIKNPGQVTDYHYWKKHGDSIFGKHHGLISLPASSHWKSLHARIDSDRDDDSGIVGFEGVVSFDVVIVPRNAVPVRMDVVKFGGYGLIGTGDRDMYTQPGRTTDLELRSELRVSEDRTSVSVDVYFRCRENHEDYTTFEGESEHLVYQAPPGSTILEIYKKEEFTHYEHRETITGRAHGRFPVPSAGSHWSRLECRVDQWFGGDQFAVGFAGTVDFQVVLTP